MQFFYRRPLFYCALLYAFLIAAASYSPPPLRDIFNPISKNDVFWQVQEAPRPVFLGGRIVSDVDTRASSYGGSLSGFVLKAERVWVGDDRRGPKSDGLVKCYLKDLAEPLRYGDEIVVKGEVGLPPALRNPGGFDKRAYWARQGIRTVLYGDKNTEVKILRRGQGNFIYAWALAARHFLSEKISKAFTGNDAAFLKALFLGERSELEEDFIDLFIKTGTMHILAVSGFNIGFLCAAVFLLLNPFPVSKNIKLLTALAAIWAYCAVVGWQAPVVRASFMASVFFLAQLLGRRADALNSLGLAACVLLGLNPQALFDIGFQLSFLAVFAIICFMPLFLKKPEFLPHELPTTKEKWVFYLEEIFWVSFVCLVVTLPVTVQNFYIVTPLSVLSNLAVVPISFLLFLSGVLFFLTAAWAHPALSWIPFFMSALMKLFTACLMAAERLPGAYFIVGKLEPPFLILLIAGIVYLLVSKKIKARFARAGALLIFILAVFVAQNFARSLDRPFRMTMLDVGQGESIYFEFPSGGNLLIDAGKGGDADKGRRVVAPFLKSKGVHKIDHFVISHPQEDHIGGSLVLFDEFRIQNVIEAGSQYSTRLFREVKQKTAEENAQRLVVRKGDRISVPDVEIKVLGPNTGSLGLRDVNDESLVLKVSYRETSFLLTGDIGEEAMSGLLNEQEDLSAMVLKVPHHGAKLKESGEAFVKRVDPAVSVISAGQRNPFHHPSQKTLEVLSSLPRNRIFRTDRHGAIEIVSDGRHLGVNSSVRS